MSQEDPPAHAHNGAGAIGSNGNDSGSGQPFDELAVSYFEGLQRRLVGRLESLDGAEFAQDAWQRPGGGGGRSCVLAEGRLFEKAGVNYSDVFGALRPDFAAHLPGNGVAFRATGVSLVLHPRNPHVPTVHANVRYIRRGDAAWFGGGTDLTPYYVVPEDAIEFHRHLKGICDRHQPSLYPRFKRWCDRYFFLPHRNEPRGIGGLFFDYLGAGAEKVAGEPAAAPSDWELALPRVFAFVRDLGDRMLDAYEAIASRRRTTPYTSGQRDWQLLRRGRYVEFNLIHDRGTLFGLRTDGRTESILMSLPPEVRWRYGFTPAPDTPEALSLDAICQRRDWVADG